MAYGAGGGAGRRSPGAGAGACCDGRVQAVAAVHRARRRSGCLPGAAGIPLAPRRAPGPGAGSGAPPVGGEQPPPALGQAAVFGGAAIPPVLREPAILDQLGILVRIPPVDPADDVVEPLEIEPVVVGKGDRKSVV